MLDTDTGHGAPGSEAEPGVRNEAAPALDVPAAPANPADPLGIGKAAGDVWAAFAQNPQALLAAQLAVASAWLGAGTRAFAPPGQKPAPLAEPAPGDARFKHPAWTENPYFDALKQGYLLASRAMLEGIENAPGVDAETKSRVGFFARQFCDALSPTNVAFLNPAVIEATLQSGGANFERGARNVAQDLRDNGGRPALVDRSAFAVGKNVATTPGQVVFRNELIELIQYAPLTPSVYARPLVIVPPWINKFYILDLQPQNSLVRFALEQGMQTFMVSWRNPGPEQAALTWEDYLELGPLAASRAAASICDSRDVNLIGYCIGGTLVATMLAYLARTGEPLTSAVTFFAALTDFAEAGDVRAFLGPEALATIDEQMRRTGVLEGATMAATFNLLRANDLIWNVAVDRYLLGKDAPAFDLLYWNDDATRLPAALHSYYLHNMYVRNALVQPDTLWVRGVPLDLRTVRSDVYAVATADDHIAPWRSVYKMTQLFSGDVRFRLGHSGHIAGIVNPPSKGKGHYFLAAANPPDADAWRASATRIEGSWWPEWAGWLAERSGETRPAPEHLGSEGYPPLAPSPGTYVLER